MRKIEKEIKSAKKTIEKLTKNNHFENNDLKLLANSLVLKTNEISDDLKEISELKIELKDKIKKLEIRKSEFEYLFNATNKLVQSESKEQAKSKKEDKDSNKKKNKADQVEKKTIVKVKKREKQEAKTDL